MANVKKPLDTLQLATTLVAMTKTAIIVTAMVLLEWARLKERRATLDAADARVDLEVEKLKTEDAQDARSAQKVVADYLAHPGAPGEPPSS